MRESGKETTLHLSFSQTQRWSVFSLPLSHDWHPASVRLLWVPSQNVTVWNDISESIRITQSTQFPFFIRSTRGENRGLNTPSLSKEHIAEALGFERKENGDLKDLER